MKHEWKSIQVETRDNGLAHVPIPGGGYVVLPPDVVHPMPGVSAGDMAVLEAADATALKHRRLIEVGTSGAAWTEFTTARDALFAAVRARAAASAEGEKVGFTPATEMALGCHICSKRATSFVLADPLGKSNRMVAVCPDHSPRYTPATPDPDLHADGDDREAEAVLEAVERHVRRVNAPVYGEETYRAVHEAGVYRYNAARAALSAARARAAPDPDIHADGADREAEVVDREDERERMAVDPVKLLADVLRLILPLAKGYAAANRHDINQRCLEAAEDALAALAQGRP